MKIVVILSGLPSEAGTLAAKLTEAIIQTGRELVAMGRVASEQTYESRTCDSRAISNSQNLVTQLVFGALLQFAPC